MKRLLVITQKVDSDDQLLGFFVPWLERLAKKSSKVVVFCLQKGNYELPSNVDVISLGKDRNLSKITQLFNFYRFIVGLRGEYDAVFVHMNPIWMVLGGIPWHLMHKHTVLWYTHKAVTLKLKFASYLADDILTASPESFRLKSSKVTVTGHGIDTELFKSNPATHLPGIHLLSVGRIAPVKNYEVLVRAADILQKEELDFSVTIIGEPALAQDIEYEKILKKMIGERGLVSRFKFIGKVINNDLPQYYQSHSIFVHLSKTGSLDKSILEAMACGMAVVSCNDAAREFLPESLIFSENDYASLALIIKNLANAETNTSILRQYVVEHHNLDGLINKIAETLCL